MLNPRYKGGTGSNYSVGPPRGIDRSRQSQFHVPEPVAMLSSGSLEGREEDTGSVPLFDRRRL